MSAAKRKPPTCVCGPCTPQSYGIDYKCPLHGCWGCKVRDEDGAVLYHPDCPWHQPEVKRLRERAAKELRAAARKVRR